VIAPENPHFSFPFTIAAGKVSVSEQDSPDEIASCVAVALSYVQGDRALRPTFGRPQNVNFSKRPIDVEALQAAVKQNEPRADVDLTEQAINERIG
jgi:hypothetical protein